MLSLVKVLETTLCFFHLNVLYSLRKVQQCISFQTKAAWNCLAREFYFSTNALWNTWFLRKYVSAWKMRQDRRCQNVGIKADRALNTSNNGINLSIAFHQQALKIKGTTRNSNFRHVIQDNPAPIYIWNVLDKFLRQWKEVLYCIKHTS